MKQLSRDNIWFKLETKIKKNQPIKKQVSNKSIKWKDNFLKICLLRYFSKLNLKKWERDESYGQDFLRKKVQY